MIRRQQVAGGSGSARGRLPALWALIGALALPTAAVRAELPADVGQGLPSARLTTPAPPHWLWVNDFDFEHMPDGRAHLVDGDTGRYLGALSTGFSFSHMILRRDGAMIYSPETYFSRGTRGTRTDVVTLYDPATLTPAGEIAIPPKRSSNSPNIADATLTDDDRFLLIYDFNPGQSVTVVDTAARRFAGEVPTPGCALVYPTGPRSFFSVCGDGGLLRVELTAAGKVAHQERTPPLFDMAQDPPTEPAVRNGDTWYFITMDGHVAPLRTTAGGTTAAAGFSLTSDAERRDGWRPGGPQDSALHAGANRLYVIMHQGPRATHKDPGKEVWVYDLGSQRRVARIALRTIATSVRVSSDPQPLLFTAFAESGDLDVYDASSGAHLRTIEHVATTPVVLLTR